MIMQSLPAFMLALVGLKRQHMDTAAAAAAAAATAEEGTVCVSNAAA